MRLGGYFSENRVLFTAFGLALALGYMHVLSLTAKPDFEATLDAVVIIQIDNKNVGTGFFFTDDGCVMTAFHVIENAVRKNLPVYIVLRGSPRRHVAAPIAGNSHLDIAIMCTDVSVRPLKIATSEGVREGDDVWVMGHPMSRTWNLTQGVVSRMSYKMHNTGKAWIPRYDLFTTAFISWGNSGGPVIDRNGNVIGMIVEWDGPGIDHPSSMNIAVPGTDLLRFIRSSWGK